MKKQTIIIVVSLLTIASFTLFLKSHTPKEELNRPELISEEDEEYNPDKNREWSADEVLQQRALLTTKKEEYHTSKNRGNGTYFTIGDGGVTGQWIDRGPENIPGAWELATIDVGTDTIYTTTCGHYGAAESIWKGTLAGTDFKMLKGSGRLPYRYRDINVLHKNGVKSLFVTVTTGPLYYSHDDGATWQKPTGLPEVLEFTVADRKNKIIYSTDGEKIYKSTDLGVTFSVAATFPSKMNTRLSSPLFASQPGYGDLFAIHGNDFYTFISGTLTKKGTLPGPATQYGSHFYLNGDTRRFYVSSSNSNPVAPEKKDSWWTSTDGGSSWTQKYPTGHYYNDVCEFANMRGFGVSPTNPDIVIGGYSHPSSSDDGFDTWYDDETYWGYYQGGSDVSSQYAELLNYYHPDFQSTHIWLDSKGKEFSLWCSDGGLLYQDKDYAGQAIEKANVPNKSWRNLMLGGGAGVTETYGFGMVNGNRGVVDFALGTQDQGIQISVDSLVNDRVVVFITTGGDGEACASGPDGAYGWAIKGDGVKSPFPLYNGTEFKGSDGRNNGTKYDITQRGIWFDLKNYSNTIWVLNENINKLIWSGSSWSKKTVSLGNTGYIGAMTQSPSNTNLFWTLANNKVFKSTDGGNSFDGGVTVAMNASTSGNVVRGWAFDDNTILFAGKSGNSVTSIISTDGGATFTEVAGLPNMEVKWMQGDKDGRVAMVSTKMGAYLFDKSQQKWYDAAGPQETGAPYFNGQWGAYIPSTNTFRFSTWGYGIWDFKLEEGVVSPFVRVNSPNGGEFINIGDTVQLSWASYIDTEDSLVLSLVQNGTITETLATVPNTTSSYQWEIPADQATGEYLIQVAVQNQSLQDESDSQFKIVDLRRLKNSHITLTDFDSEEPSNPAKNVLDEVSTTFWHTAYSASQPPFPHTITFVSDTTVELAAFSYLPRQDGSANGRIKAYTIEVSNDGVSWDTVGQGELANTSEKSLIIFDKALEATKVRFIMESEQGGQFYASMAEFELYYLHKKPTSITIGEVNQRVQAITLMGIEGNRLNISVGTAGKYKITIHSLNGRILFSQNRDIKAGVSSINMRIVGVARQVGIIQISNGINSLTQKISIQ